MNIKNIAIVAAIGVGTLALVGCTRTMVKYSDGTTTVATSSSTASSKKGPPPHAPAHGYRHKHGNTVLVYEKSLSLYIVSGHADYYFHGEKYYRSHKGGWQSAKSMDGKWKKVKTNKLPPGLRSHDQAKGNGKSKKK